MFRDLPTLKIVYCAHLRSQLSMIQLYETLILYSGRKPNGLNLLNNLINTINLLLKLNINIPSHLFRNRQFLNIIKYLVFFTIHLELNGHRFFKVITTLKSECTTNISK